jgi:pimeloyl-ACP methyl ester carboxylesterase
LHGWGQSKSSLRSLGELLAADAQVHLIDLPGFGESPRPATDWGTQEYADCILQYLDEHGVQATVLLGHSFGGRIAVRFASLHPSRVQALVLMSAAGVPRRRSLTARVRLWFVRLLGLLIKTLDRSDARKWRTWFGETFGSRDYRAAGDLRGILVKHVGEDLSAAAREIRCPTLLLWGGQDRETPPEMAVRFNELITNSKLIIMPGKDHFPYEDVGAHLCAYYIIDWLHGLESSER